MESPSGIFFQSKSKGINHLVQTGGSEADMDMLREMYVEEGWSRQGLPEGWVGKETLAQVAAPVILMLSCCQCYQGRV